MSNEVFRTSDLPLVSVLLYERCKLLSLDREQPRTEFVFENSQKLQQLVAQYWTDDLMCPAQSLLASFKRAKHILHDYRE